MEGEFTGVSVQTNAAEAAGQQSGQEAAAQAQVQQQPVNVPDAQGQGTQQEETFDSLIQGRFKKDFDSAVQRVVKQRVRGLNQYKGQAEAMAPIIDQLGALYGMTRRIRGRRTLRRWHSAFPLTSGFIAQRPWKRACRRTPSKRSTPAGPRIRLCGDSCRSTRCEKPSPGSRQTLPGM